MLPEAVSISAIGFAGLNFKLNGTVSGQCGGFWTFEVHNKKVIPIGAVAPPSGMSVHKEERYTLFCGAQWRPVARI